MRRRFIRKVTVGLGAVGLVLGLAAGTANAATTPTPTPHLIPVTAHHVTRPAGQGNAIIYDGIVCQPSLSGGAFPYVASTGSPPLFCGRYFAWGFTVSGNATGQARWDSPFVGPGWTCTAKAWIPDSHSNDPHAQYYIFDGSHYLANDSFVNQQDTTNGWVNIANNDWFPTTDHMVVTLSDHNPFGESGKYEAAYAVQFLCY